MAARIEYALFRLLEAILSRLPFGAARRVGTFLGLVAMEVFRFRRAVTLENLTHAFPELPRSEILRRARGAYRNYGTAIMELFWTGRATPEALVDKVHLRDPAIVLEACSRGTGLILLSAHFGSWEFLLSGVRLQFPRRFVAIVQRQANQYIDAFLDARRQRFDNLMIPMGPSVREVLRALRNGELLLMLGDQSGSKESIYVDFFGRPSATHRGAAAFSLKTGSPILMLFMIRQPDGRYEVVCEEVDRTGLHESTEENIVELTRRHTAILEKYIRLYPDHWLWMHKRWKHTPSYQERHRPVPAGSAGAVGS